MFATPIFTLPVLVRRSEEYGLTALLGRDHLPRRLCTELDVFNNWSSELVQLDRCDHDSC
jgi:hypothetical protein